MSKLHSDLHKGLVNRSPSCEDSSTKLPTSKSTVDNDAVRKEVAPTPEAQGPRTA